MRKYKLQLFNALLGIALSASGGAAYVTASGGTGKLAITDSLGAAKTNPIALTSGSIEFYTADAVQSVDLYIQTASGHFRVATGIAGGDNRIDVNVHDYNQTMVIPFNIADTAATVETNTGFSVPTHAMVLPSPAIKVTAIDATETIDVGTLSSASGDADGFIALLSVGTLGLAKATVLNSGDTMGAYFKVQDSVNAGDDALEGAVVPAGKAITYTLTAGSDTAAGFISLGYRLVV